MVSKDKITKVSESYFIGDIVDLANCKKKHLEKAKQIRWELATRSLGWVDGNHERIDLNNTVLMIHNSVIAVIAVHGDFEAWGDKKAIAYRSKKHGAGWFKRNLWVRSLKVFEKFGKHKPKQKMINNLIKKAKDFEASVIICGHTHPKKTYDEVHDGVRVIVLKRGLNEVDI
jgi:UDP-2,3-diacylglucosamine pyrophosphatase LpxH